ARAGKPRRQRGGLRELAGVDGLVTHFGVDHHGELTRGRGERNRPRPAVAIAFDDRVSAFVGVPLDRSPFGGHGERAVPRLGDAQAAARDRAGAARAVQNIARTAGLDRAAVHPCGAHTIADPHVAYEAVPKADARTDRRLPKDAIERIAPDVEPDGV